MPIWIPDHELVFPPHQFADETGLLAIGGSLSIQRLILAYENGIFPWFSPPDPPLWYSPDPRFVLYPQDIVISKSMRSILKKNLFTITYNQCFEDVVINCGSIKRNYGDGTWITEDIIKYYSDLQKLNRAFSVEVWQENKLVGGLYGVVLGNIFIGESMFAKVSNASKAGFITFIKDFTPLGLELIDCQVYSSHLQSLGAKMIKREHYLDILSKNKEKPPFFLSKNT
jgi:leucyl/phenylalanyl-tRNA--protein transferase